MADHGGIPEDSEEKFQDDMIFVLNPLRVSKDLKENPMWSLESPASVDWFLSEE